MTETTMNDTTKKKARGAKRDPAVIEKELEERLAKLREKKRLASTPGLKALREAYENLYSSADEATKANADHGHETTELMLSCGRLIAKLEK